jgi:hypothetical protein
LVDEEEEKLGFVEKRDSCISLFGKLEVVIWSHRWCSGKDMCLIDLTPKEIHSTKVSHSSPSSSRNIIIFWYRICVRAWLGTKKEEFKGDVILGLQEE